MALSASLENWNATRRTLLDRLKNWEDHESWRVFFDIYSRLVYSFALKAGLTGAEAEEVVQETFISVAKKMPEFNYDPAKGSFKSWLLHTTQWRIADQFRKRNQRIHVRISPRTSDRTPTSEQIPDPGALNLEKLYEEEWQQNLFLFALEKVKRQVNARHFQMFDLYVVKKWPARRVAKTLGVSTSRVYLAKHRVAGLVKKEIQALDPESI